MGLSSYLLKAFTHPRGVTIALSAEQYKGCFNKRVDRLDLNLEACPAAMFLIILSVKLQRGYFPTPEPVIRCRHFQQKQNFVKLTLVNYA